MMQRVAKPTEAEVSQDTAGGVDLTTIKGRDTSSSSSPITVPPGDNEEQVTPTNNSATQASPIRPSGRSQTIIDPDSNLRLREPLLED